MKIRLLLSLITLIYTVDLSAQLLDTDTAYVFLTPDKFSNEAKSTLKNSGTIDFDITYEIVRDDMIPKKTTWTEGQFCDCQTCYASWDYNSSENCTNANGSPLGQNQQYDFTWKIDPGAASNLNSDTLIFILAVAETNFSSNDTVVFFAVKDPTVSIESVKIEIEQSFEVLPNPIKGNATLKFFTRKNVDMSVSVIDVLGNEVTSEDFSNKEGHIEEQLSFEQMDAGIYFVNLFVDGERFTKKVIVE